MSAISAASLSPSLTGSGLPAINPATEPEAVRTGGAAAKSAYQQGLAFGDVLMNMVSQQLTDSVSGSTDGSDDSSDDSSGGDGSSDPSTGAYSSLLPQALTQGIMSAGGGTGIALQIAEGIDPKLALGPGDAGHASSSSAAGTAKAGA